MKADVKIVINDGIGIIPEDVLKEFSGAYYVFPWPDHNGVIRFYKGDGYLEVQFENAEGERLWTMRFLPPSKIKR